MDTLADMLLPEDELAAAQAEIICGIWLAELLEVLRDRAKCLHVQIESMYLRQTVTTLD